MFGATTVLQLSNVMVWHLTFLYITRAKHAFNLSCYCHYRFDLSCDLLLLQYPWGNFKKIIQVDIYCEQKWSIKGFIVYDLIFADILITLLS